MQVQEKGKFMLQKAVPLMWRQNSLPLGLNHPQDKVETEQQDRTESEKEHCAGANEDVPATAAQKRHHDNEVLARIAELEARLKVSDAKITLPVSILLIFCLQNAPLTQLSVPSSSTSTSKHCKTMTPTAFPALSRIVPSDADLMLLTNKKVNSGIVHNIHPFSVPQLESRFSLRCQWHHAAVNG